MPKCPECDVVLDCRFKICTKDEDRPVERDYQWWRCSRCDARFTAECVEDRTNIFDDDIEQTGYRVGAAEWDASMKKAQRCPTKGKWPCSCEAHSAPYTALPRGPIAFS